MNLRKIIREEIDGVFTDIHGKKSSPVDYTGVIIEGDEIGKFESQVFDRLRKMNVSIPMGWSSPENYHMTITRGPLGLGLQMSGAIGSEIKLKAHSLGISDKAIAIGVQGLFSRSEVQHITFAFKDNPKDSNEIVKWTEFESFEVTGYVREIDKPDGFGRLTQIEV